MKQIPISSINRLIIAFVFLALLSCSKGKSDDISAKTKIALRDVGNKLLLSNNDTTSLILPVIELQSNVYQLKFSSPLTIEPSHLVAVIKESFNTLQLPQHYRVEILQCAAREVAYSYLMSSEKERIVIPCAGRFLPKACYIIEVKFAKSVVGWSKFQIVILIIFLLVLIRISYLIFQKKRSKRTGEDSDSGKKLGSFYFYPEQNKLVKEAQEIALSKKECELLALFVANPNQILKRDELTKRVWEDNGVFVGRSLDTYISKLRKKLKEDNSIKLTNIHGVGYKLETD